jgi:hypothetical protein
LKAFDNIYGATERHIAAEREGLGNIDQGMVHYHQLTDFHLKHHNLKKSTYSRRKYLRLKWNKKVQV